MTDAERRGEAENVDVPEAEEGAAPEPEPAPDPAPESAPDAVPDADPAPDVAEADADPTSDHKRVNRVLDGLVPSVDEAPAPPAPAPLDETAQVYDLPAEVYDRFAPGAAVAPPAKTGDAPDRYDHVPGEGKSRRKGRAVAALVLLLTVIVAAVVFATYQLEFWGGRAVPAVVGQTQELATTNMEERGFSVTVQEEFVDEDAGKVLSTDPAAGTRAEPNSSVTLHVGRARTVPEVVGLSAADARQALMDAGAQSVALSYQGSSQPAGTAIGVDPTVGSTFTANQTLTLVVAQAYTVPYLVGQQSDVALQTLADEGLQVQVSYVLTGKDDQGQVLECSPQQGATIEAGGTVTLTVSAKEPTDYRHLLDYYAFQPHVVADFLASQGFELQSNYLENSYLYALYASADKGTLVFSPEPYWHTFDSQKDVADTDYLPADQAFTGIRLEVPIADLPADAGSLSGGALQALMDLCGFKDPKQVVNQDSVTLPAGVKKNGTAFACAYGEEGDHYWTVLIVNEGGGTRATVTTAPKALYDAVDLSQFGGSVCSMVAYADVYSK